MTEPLLKFCGKGTHLSPDHIFCVKLRELCKQAGLTEIVSLRVLTTTAPGRKLQPGFKVVFAQKGGPIVEWSDDEPNQFVRVSITVSDITNARIYSALQNALTPREDPTQVPEPEDFDVVLRGNNTQDSLQDFLADEDQLQRCLEVLADRAVDGAIAATDFRKILCDEFGLRGYFHQARSALVNEGFLEKEGRSYRLLPRA